MCIRDRIESGQLALQREGFDPRELVENCIASYAGVAERKGLVIYSGIDLSLIHIYGPTPMSRANRGGPTARRCTPRPTMTPAW